MLAPDELGPFSQLSSVHCDGWGLAAWDDADDLIVIRDTGPAMREPGLLAECARVSTDAALLHLRKASVGLPVTPANTHPFAVGSVAFAHNGYFPPNAAGVELLDELGAGQCAGFLHVRRESSTRYSPAHLRDDDMYPAAGHCRSMAISWWETRSSHRLNTARAASSTTACS